MSRPVRLISPTGMYHIVVRGLDGLQLFGEPKEFDYFLEQLEQVSEGFRIYAYCLLTNEIQLFFRESEEGTVPEMMRRLLTRYAGWYNRKHHRRGSVTEGRYQCALVKAGDESSLIRSIHQLSGDCFGYPYSSFSSYERGEQRYPSHWFDGDVIFFHRQSEERDFTIRPSGKLTDRQVKEQVELFCSKRNISDWKQLSKAERDAYLRELRERFSIGQLQAATGISRGIIARCTMEKVSKSQAPRQMESFLL
ncbi:MAG: hypothetical protein E7399_01385 [Ruminococcaceae bacterium]|nr:hypothetical protein [Oscillospiraceae bacterium]